MSLSMNISTGASSGPFVRRDVEGDPHLGGELIGRQIQRQGESDDRRGAGYTDVMGIGDPSPPGRHGYGVRTPRSMRATVLAEVLL